MIGRDGGDVKDKDASGGHLMAGAREDYLYLSSLRSYFGDKCAPLLVDGTPCLQIPRFGMNISSKKERRIKRA